MQYQSFGDNLHEMSNLSSGKNKKNISNCHLLKFSPRMLSIKVPITTAAEYIFICLFLLLLFFFPFFF